MVSLVFPQKLVLDSVVRSKEIYISDELKLPMQQSASTKILNIYCVSFTFKSAKCRAISGENIMCLAYVSKKCAQNVRYYNSYSLADICRQVHICSCAIQTGIYIAIIKLVIN